jgi:hypothetical protein
MQTVSAHSDVWAGLGRSFDWCHGMCSIAGLLLGTHAAMMFDQEVRRTAAWVCFFKLRPLVSEGVGTHAVLQVHAGNGLYEAALEACFTAAPDNGGGQAPGAAAAGLAAQMEVADAVLRLVADNAATPSIRCERRWSGAPLLATIGSMHTAHRRFDGG